MFQNYLKAWHFVWLRCGRSEFVYSTISTFLPKMHWDAFATNGVKQMAWKIPESAKQNRGEQTSGGVTQQHLVPTPPLIVLCISGHSLFVCTLTDVPPCKGCGIPSRCLAHKKNVPQTVLASSIPSGLYSTGGRWGPQCQHWILL